MRLVHDDGGRAAAGFKGTTADCVCRAIAIATEVPYADVYAMLALEGSRERTGRRKRGRSHPRTGVYNHALRRVLERLGRSLGP